MQKLQIFIPENGFLTGINTPQFSQLEYLATISKSSNTPLPNIGLFGEASTGKTTAAELLSKSLGYTMVYFNASDLTLNKINSKVVEEFKKLSKHSVLDSSYSCWYNGKGHHWDISGKRVLVFIDEAHLLTKNVQGTLLSVFDSMTKSREIGVFLEDATSDFPSFKLRNVSFVLATTDTGKLLYPLLTRMNSIVFDQYSKADIKNIIDLRYNNFSDEAKTVLANCSKLVPRVALRLAEQVNSFTENLTITGEAARSFAKTFLNMEENGIDSIDKRILTYLSHYKKKGNTTDQTTYTLLKEQKKKLNTRRVLSDDEYEEYKELVVNLKALETKIKNVEYECKSRRDISLACRILDLTDLEIRLTFLESLSYIKKTPKGIMLDECYL